MSEADTTSNATSEGPTVATDPGGALVGTRRAALAAAAAATAGFLAEQALAPDRAEAEEITSVNGLTGKAIVLPGLTPKGGNLLESVVTSSAPGFSPETIYLDTTPEFYGAVGHWLGEAGEYAHNDTAAFQLCAEAIKGKLTEGSSAGGGVMRLSAKEYIVDGYEWLSGIKHEGRGALATVLRAAHGSGNAAQITIPAGRVTHAGWKGVTFLPNGNAGQHCMYFYAREGTTHDGGMWECKFEDVVIGRNYAEKGINGWWEGCCMWFRGGFNVASLLPHQFIDFKNVVTQRANTGAAAATSRSLRLSGQCEKFTFDNSCNFNGYEASSHLGTNVEIGREFLEATTLAAEAVAGATVVEVAATTGLTEKGKIFSIGEGAFNEICEVESVAGVKITLKAALKFTHVSSTHLYALSGTVASPATAGPAEIKWFGGAIQCADLQVLVDAGTSIEWFGTDMEQQSRCAKIRGESFQINFFGIRPDNAYEGTTNGTGVVTGGIKSNKVTGATGTWAPGNLIYSQGAGIPQGTTVAEVGGTTLTLSAEVGVNGTEGAITVTLTKGEGKGYIALYEGIAEGICSYHISGTADQGVIREGEAGVRMGPSTRHGALPTQTSSGVTVALAPVTSLKVFLAREVVLTSAAAAVQTIQGLHATGETVTFRATVAKTKIETGGNIHLAGKALVELAAGETATFLRTDYGASTWILISLGTPQVGIPGAYEAREAGKEYEAPTETTTVYLTIRAKAEATAYEVIVDGKSIYKPAEETIPAGAADFTHMFRIKAKGKWEVKMNKGALSELHSVYQGG